MTRCARLRGALLAASALSAAAGAASAQTATAGPENGSAPAEVVVTARHRLENLQSVPIAISVVEGADAARKNLNDIQDISSQVPAVDFRTSASNKDQTVFVRGVGTISTSPGVEPSVSTVIDGVVLARSGMATVDLLDLDHIEVLRGPQGTLFGKNASAGVINIVTKSPTNRPTAYIDGSYYEGNEYRLGAGVSGPISDTVKGLLSGFWGHYDGNVENLALHEKVNGYDNAGLRGKLIATPTDKLTLTVGADFTRSTETIPTGVWATTNRVAYPTDVNTNYPGFAAFQAQQGITPSSDNRTVSQDTKSSAHDDQGGLSLQADYEFGGGFVFTSITAWRNWYNTQLQDYDQMSAANATYPGVVDIGHLNFSQISQEVRVASPKGRFIDFVAGAFILDGVDRERYQRTDTLVAANGSSSVVQGVGHYGSTDVNYAVFGEANINFTPSFRGILGIRQIWDELSFYNTRGSNSAAAVVGIQPSFAGAGTETKDGQAGRAGLQWDVSRHLMLYATYARGYKGPAYNVFFNQTATVTAPLKPETSDDYEIGLKGRFLENRLQADVSAFRTTFSNYQANSTFLVGGALVTNLVNAGTVRSQGVEGDFTFRPVRALTLDFNAIWDDAQVVNFPCPAGSPVTCNINGQALPFAPKWKIHTQADYRWPIAAAMDVDVETDWNWQSATQYQLGQTPQTIQPGYGIWNASVALLSAPQGWSVRFSVKNIANQHYSSYLAPGNEGSTGIVRWVPRDDHRYVGVNLHKDF